MERKLIECSIQRCTASYDSLLSKDIVLVLCKVVHPDQLNEVSKR
jgi:hypothetical protein